MKLRRISIGAALLMLITTCGVTPAFAADPTECTARNSKGYCVEWDSGGHDATPSTSGQGGGSGAVVCYWLNLPTINDPAIFADYDLPYPPAGAEIQWQGWFCSDGSVQDRLQWVFAIPPRDLANQIRIRIEGTLAAPAVVASPPLGTPSIIGVPVFVSVSNWTGVVTDSGCGGGLCVTVTATPKLSFSPGESGSNPITCDGAGTKFNRAIPPATQAKTSGACAYSYKLRTGAQNRPAEWPGSVTVVWNIAWTATTGDAGTLPAVTRTLALPRGVQEVQTIVVGGDTP